jgi:hypothetical protein
LEALEQNFEVRTKLQIFILNSFEVRLSHIIPIFYYAPITIRNKSTLELILFYNNTSNCMLFHNKAKVAEKEKYYKYIFLYFSKFPISENINFKVNFSLLFVPSKQYIFVLIEINVNET